MSGERWDEPRGMRRPRYEWELMRPGAFGGPPQGGAWRYDRDMAGSRRYDEEARWRRARRAAPRGSAYEADYWWLGEREMERQGHRGGYDEAYRRFDDAAHPRYSPVGGMYPAMGGRYASRRPPRELREDTRFSDWTRWF